MAANSLLHLNQCDLFHVYVHVDASSTNIKHTKSNFSGHFQVYQSEPLVLLRTYSRINALHRWCLRMLLGIKWYHFISNDEVRRQTNQPLLTEIIAYRPNGRQCRCKADPDFLTFCILEQTTRTTADDLDEDGAEQPRLPRAVMDQRSRPGPEPTTLEAVGNQWCYALVVVQAGEEEGHFRLK